MNNRKLIHVSSSEPVSLSTHYLEVENEGNTIASIEVQENWSEKEGLGFSIEMLNIFTSEEEVAKALEIEEGPYEGGFNEEVLDKCITLLEEVGAINSANGGAI